LAHYGIFFSGIAMAYGYERTRSILPVILAHSLYNVESFVAAVLLAH
jgi:membrane protease YdiL (CAAX protease family)